MRYEVQFSTNGSTYNNSKFFSTKASALKWAKAQRVPTIVWDNKTGDFIAEFC